MVSKTQAIKNFLMARGRQDLAIMYTPEMECQVNVASDGGERVTEEYRGRKWAGWSDGITTWKSFRIPFNASTEPEYEDRPMAFDLEAHVEAIGMTGWDWKNRVSKWVAFDFDDIVTHNHEARKTLSKNEIDDLVNVSSQVEWVTIRKSTSGRGIHLYVFLNDFPTHNHTEHAAVARSILGKLSALTGYDFASKVDACGGNMWVWHRKTGEGDGLTVIKQGVALDYVPANWQDHVKVVSGKKNRTTLAEIQRSSSSDNDDPLEVLSGQCTKIPLEDEHKALMAYLEETGATWWWDADHHMLITHTLKLKEAHTALCLKGFFETLSKGTTTHNCFAFPLKGGAWAIRRYSIGIEEHPSWEQDTNGWTKCYYNRIPSFDAACRSYEGLEDPSGGYCFRDTLSAQQAAKTLGIGINVPDRYLGRKCRLKQHRDGRIIIELDADSLDRGDEMSNWLQKKGSWIKIYSAAQQDLSEPDSGNYDEVVRHIVTESGEDYGWVIKVDNEWKHEPLAHIRLALSSIGLSFNDAQLVLGSSVFKCWTLVNKPFQDEYPGNREWNRNAAQFSYKPTQNTDNLKTPHWDKILNHIGKSLDDAVAQNPWARANGLKKGADYLRCWIASVFQFPLQPLPYLFLYGPQDSGKSILHEALSLLLTRGYKMAEQALINSSGFNGELDGAILCVVEEIDLSKSKTAYNRIKEWVTAREISIHAKCKTPYHVPNATHWIQTANLHSYCPVFPGDTRITVCFVPDIDPLDKIPKARLIKHLEEEAADFMATMLRLEIPDSKDRLNVPVMITEDKNVMQQMNQSPLETFIAEKTIAADGYCIKFSEFYDQLVRWLDPDDVVHHTKTFVSRNIPPQYPKGRSTKDAQHYVGNIAWRGEDIENRGQKYVFRAPFIRLMDVTSTAVDNTDTGTGIGDIGSDIGGKSLNEKLLDAAAAYAGTSISYTGTGVVIPDTEEGA